MSDINMQAATAEIIKLQNDQVQKINDAVTNGILVKTIEYVFSDNGDAAAIQNVYVYRPGHPLEGTSFKMLDMDTIDAILKKYDITEDADKERLVKELDESGSKLYTAFDESNGLSDTVGYAKKSLQIITVTAVMAHIAHSIIDPTKNPITSLIAKRIAALEKLLVRGRLGVGTLPIKNALMAVKSFAAILEASKGDTKPLVELSGQWAIYAVIHTAAGPMARIVSQNTGKPIAPAIVAGVLEVIWIFGDYVITYLNKKSLADGEYKKRVVFLEKEADERNCLKQRYVETNGKCCIPCALNSTPTNIFELPIDVKRDKNGDPILDSFIYPPPPQQYTPKSGGGPGQNIPLPPGYSFAGPRNFYGPPTSPGQNPAIGTSITQTYTNPNTGQEETVAFKIPSHNQSIENKYLSHINAEYVSARNADYVQNLMTVKFISSGAGGGGDGVAAINAGPIYSATAPAMQSIAMVGTATTDAINELNGFKKRDALLHQKDQAWRDLLWSGGSTDGSGAGVSGGGSTPPPDSGGKISGGVIAAITRGTFVLDMGFDILYVSNGAGTIISKSNRPTTQYSSDGMG